MNFNHHWTRYLFHAYLVVLVWVPLPFASRPAWATSLFNLLVALLTLAALLGLYRTGHVLPPAWRRARPVWVLWGAYLAWLGCQQWAGFSINGFRSQQQLWLTLSYVQLFGLTLLLVDTRDRLKILCYVLIGSGLFQALYGGLMALSGVDRIWWVEKAHHKGLATGTFRNRNQLANYLVLCLSLGCALLIAAQQGQSIRNWRDLLRKLLGWLLSGTGWLRLLMAALVIGVVLTHSRMGNASLFVSLTVVGLVWLWRSRVPRVRAGLLVGSLLLVDALIVGAWFGIDKVVERLQATRTEHAVEWVTGDGHELDAEATAPGQAAAAHPAQDRVAYSLKKDGNELRDEALPSLLRMARAHLWTGIGLGNFSTGFTAYSDLLIISIYNEAHCDYLQFLIEVGLVGTVLLALIVLWCLREGFLALWRPRSRLLQGAGFAVCMAGVASLLHAWVDFNFQSPATASLFVVIMALGVVAQSLPGRGDGSGASRRGEQDMTGGVA